MIQEQTRRDFLRAAALGAAGVAAVGAVTPARHASAGEATSSASDASASEPAVTEELVIVPIYPYDDPEQTSYSCDVLVIGCGFAGLNAAYCARQAGAEVMVVEKGTPGYSGLSAWPNCHAFFDADLGDDAEQHQLCHVLCGEGIGNYCWSEAWINESKDIMLRLKEFGIIDTYTRGGDDENEFWQNLDYPGYREKYASQDRHMLFGKVLDDNGIPYVSHLMVTNVIVEDGRAAGAVGFITTTGTVIRIDAKAVVMAMGGGVIVPGGFPAGSNSFDAEYIAYNLGLPITGKETEDYHWSGAAVPQSSFIGTSWEYLENLWLDGGGDGNDGTAFAISECTGRFGTVSSGEQGISYYEVDPTSRKSAPDPIDWTKPGKAGATNFGTDPNEIRSGKHVSDHNQPNQNTPVGAPGMCAHMTSGVWCGYGDLDCATAIPGLYVAGDGTHALQWEGNMYGGYNGVTSNMVSIDGSHAGKAAAEYAAGVEAAGISEESYAAAVEEIEGPLNQEKGFDPSWARDILQSIMAPYWMVYNKTEDTLTAGLFEVEYLRDNVIPKLQARNPHELRLCHEMRHKVLASELKIRASLFRKESRGFFWRRDYVGRNDDEFLGQVVCTKGEDGSVQVALEKTPEEWLSVDLSKDYLERYPFFHYGELKELGLTDKDKIYTLEALEEDKAASAQAESSAQDADQAGKGTK